jgi:RNA-directed DNA polymerase
MILQQFKFMSLTINNNLAWTSIRWSLIKSRVRRTQRRIYKAKRLGHNKRVHWLQLLLLNSLDAKLLAVLQATTLNKGKNTDGVDRKRALTAPEKLALANKLKLDGKAHAIRRVSTPKPGKFEKRPLGIPTHVVAIEDRAKQALAKLALEPEWEAVFEPNSYGFRPARSAHDAIEAIFLGLHHKTPKWVFDADMRKCFDCINHEALLSKLETFPLMEAQIQAWLKADIMEGYANSPKSIKKSVMGTPQGGIISPLLANIALHGLENHLKNFVTKLPKPHNGANRGSAAKQKALTIVRYADDFVIIHRNLEILKPCIEETKLWLSKLGLVISEEKSAIRDIRQGFAFLGFKITQVVKDREYKVKITPSLENQKLFLQKVKKVIQFNKASSAYKLIRTLRPIIIGWANYYRYCECKDVFSKLTHYIFQKLRAWAFRRDKRNGRLAIKEKYFPSGKTYTFKGISHKDNWILYGKEKSKNGVLRETFLPHIVWVPSETFVKVKGDKSPYDGDDLYWGTRLNKYQELPTRTKTLMKRQKMICAKCNKLFTPFDDIEVDHIIPIFKGGKDSYENLQLLHRECHVGKTKFDLKPLAQ